MTRIPPWLRVALAATFVLVAPPTSAQTQAGAASVEFQPPAGTPLAGFAGLPRRRLIPNPFPTHSTFFHSHHSVSAAAPIRVKALLLRDGAEDLVFLSLDLVAVTADLRNDIVQDIASASLLQSNAHVMVSATHTHSGPGAVSRELFWELLASDCFDPEVHQPLLDAVNLAVQGAVANLTGPVTLRAGEVPVPGVQKNRHDWRALDFVDPLANVLVVEAGGRIDSALVNIGVHATVLSASNFELSADLPGHIENELGAALAQENGDGLAVPVLFLNGAEGDVSPEKDPLDPFSGATKVRDEVMTALPMFREVPVDFEVSQMPLDLGKSKWVVGTCIDNPPGWFVPNWLTIPLPFVLDGQTEIWSIRLGDMRLMTVPGEPTTELGLDLRAAGNAEAGIVQTWVLGLTNDYRAYFPLSHEFAHPSYAPCSALFGQDAGQAIADAHQALLGP